MNDAILSLAPGVVLPIEATTETFAVLGTKGSGKSTAAKQLVEQLTIAGSQCVVVDPVGAWFGLASSRDGRSAGLPFTILGGDHGALPLSPASGEVIADLVVDSTTPLVLDLSLMRKTEMRRFVLAFAETLYHRNREPVMLVVDEADLFAGQRMEKGDMRLLGAMEDIARRGRRKGIGLCAISQRPASMHKDVLSQLSVLVCMRLIGPQDRGAVDDWVAAHGDKVRRDEMMATLAGLQPGEAWIWSPSWLDLFKRAAISLPSTFDSMATPKAGVKTIVPKVLSKVDVDALREKLASFVAEAEANDPRVLKQRIVVLERELAKRPAVGKSVPPTNVEKIVHVEVPVADPAAVAAAAASASAAQRDIAVTAVEALRAGLAAAVDRALDDIRTAVADTVVAPLTPAKVAAAAPESPRPRPLARTAAPDMTPTPPSPRPAPSGAALSKAEAAILNVLAQFPAGRTKVQLALLSGYSIKSSSLGNALGALRSAGYVEKGGSPIRATADGVSAAGDVEPLPSGDALFAHWCNQLSKAEVAILTYMVEQHPDDVTKDDLAAATGYSSSSSSMGNALGRLRSLELVTAWHANDDFVAAIQR